MTTFLYVIGSSGVYVAGTCWVCHAVNRRPVYRVSRVLRTAVLLIALLRIRFSSSRRNT